MLMNIEQSHLRIAQLNKTTACFSEDKRPSAGENRKTYLRALRAAEVGDIHPLVDFAKN